MSTQPRPVLISAVALGLVLGLVLGWYALSLRLALELQQARQDRDAAVALALRIQHADPASAPTTRLAEAFEQSGVVALLFSPGEGRPPIVFRRATRAPRAPDWFVSLLPIDPAPAWTPLPLPGQAAAALQVVGPSAAAQEALWSLCLRALCAALVMVISVVGVAVLLFRYWRRALDPVIGQAKALEQGRLLEIDEPEVSVLRPLASSLNGAVHRLREMFGAQARQVAQLQRLAQLDAVTGLPLRRGFLGLLQQRLAGEGGPGTALLLLQVPQLEKLNRRLGHEATDRLLGVIGDLLLTYVDRVPGAFAGRLNGSDFGLCLPVSGVALETADSLQTALASSPALRTAGTQILVAGVDGLRETTVGAALASADAALARAQAEEQVAIDTQGELVAAVAGARAWREQISAALAEGRTALDEYPVVDRDGALIHLECPLRVQLTIDGPYEAARRWLALARRSRLLPQVDLAVIDLALRATGFDANARAVHVSQASLGVPDFIGEVAKRLAAAPRAAAKLSIECVQGSAATDIALLAKAAAAWRPWGVRVGIEYSGGSPQQLPALQNAGIDYVKVDARNLRGLGSDEALRGYAQSLVALIHGLGLAAVAEGIDDPRDLAALWPIDFDGATGSAAVRR